MKLNKESTDRIQWAVAGFCLGMFVSSLVGCSLLRPDPFHVETHYPKWVYEQAEREDGAFIEWCQTNDAWWDAN